MILIFTAALASPAPSPTPRASADPCGTRHTNLLASLNRPSIGYSACAVKPRDAVAELGYAQASGTQSLATYPQGFLRYGAAPNFELDVIGPAYGVLHTPAARSSGYFDSGLGAKYEFWHDGGRAFAADFLYTVPTGASQFTAGGPVATINLDYSAPLAGNFSIASTLGLQSAHAASLAGANGGFFSLLPSVVVADQWNPRAQAFIEAYAQTRTRPDGGASFGEDLALQYLLTPQVEVDVEIGRTASDVARSHYAGFGFGLRL